MSRTIDLKLIEPASYSRKPLWEAEDRMWPSIDAVQFRADDHGNGNLMRIAGHLLDDSERECAVD